MVFAPSVILCLTFYFYCCVPSLFHCCFPFMFYPILLFSLYCFFCFILICLFTWLLTFVLPLYVFFYLSFLSSSFVFNLCLYPFGRVSRFLCLVPTSTSFLSAFIVPSSPSTILFLNTHLSLPVSSSDLFCISLHTSLIFSILFYLLTLSHALVALI